MTVPEEWKPCMKKALDRLGRGDLTAAQMLTYLTEKKPGKIPFSAKTARGTVELLISEGFIDDRRYLSLFLERLDAKKFGPRKIREELVKAKFSPNRIARAMEREIDFSARARLFLRSERDAAALSQTPEGRKKLAARLIRKGFDYADAYNAVKTVCGTDEEEQYLD